MNNPGNDGEGQLIRTISQSKVAPQGLCVVNTSGQALAWVATFHDGQAIESFLNHSLDLFGTNSNGQQPFRTERYMNFPDDRQQDGGVEPRLGQCTAILQSASVPHRTIDGMMVRLVGRALDQRGRFLSDTLQQEHYVEHKIELPRYVQELLLRDMRMNGNDRFPLPEPLAHWMMQEAFLGQLDMQPLRDGERGAINQIRTCNLFAQRTGQNELEITGDTEVSTDNAARFGDGARYSNYIKLHWQGVFQFGADGIDRVLLLARGFEKARWQSGPGLPNGACPSRDELVKFLPGGHQFSLDCPVVFGFAGIAPGNHVSIIPSRKEVHCE